MDNSTDIAIQLTDWYCADSKELSHYKKGKHLYKTEYYYSPDSDDDADEEDDEDSGERDPNEEKEFKSRFVIYMFGLTETGKSVSVKVEEFKPFFYIRLPDMWKKIQLDILVNKLKDKVFPKKYKTALVGYEFIKAKPFYGFTADDKFNFAKLIFHDNDSFRKWSFMFKKELTIYGLNGNQPHKYELYESNINPMIRFAHINEITPSGWVTLPAKKYTVVSSIEKQTTCHLEVIIDNKFVKPIKNKTDIAPMCIAAFDIEADSSHGDFPIPKKDYQKLAQDIMTQYVALLSDGNEDLIGKPRKVLEKWLKLAFDDYYQNYGINRIITEEGLKPDSDSLDIQIPQFLTICQEYSQINRTIKELTKTKHGDETQHVDKDMDAHGAEQKLKEQTDYIKTLQYQKMQCKHRLHSCFETILPAIDLEVDKNSHYNLLAGQILEEYAILDWKNTKILRDNPQQWIKYVINLAFDEIFDAHNINRIYTKKNVKPTAVLKNIIPEVYRICTGCAEMIENNKKKRKLGKKWADKNIKEDKNQPPPKTRDDYVVELTKLLNSHLPEVEGDITIQIGTTFQRYGEKHPYLKHIIVLDTCEDIDNKRVIEDEHKDIIFPDGELLSSLTKFYKDLKSDNINVNANKVPNFNISNELQTLLHCFFKDKETAKIKNLSKKERQELNDMILDYNFKIQCTEDKATVVVERYKTEREVLMAWKKLIQRTDPDMIIGYNVFGFDYKFLYDRSDELGVMKEFTKLGRFKDLPQGITEQILTSSGLGENILNYIPMAGRVIVDLLKVVQANHKLAQYTLNFVSKHFMYKSKNDISPQDIFIKQKGSAADRRLIAEYCLIDCVLCLRLIDKLDIITNNIGMSNVCLVPLSYLFLRGQGVKIFSLVANECRQENTLTPVHDKDLINQKDDGYEGAIVLKPKTNIYFEPVAVCDFNSLYPSCMISENLSHDSYVIPSSKYDNLPDYDYVDIPYDLYREEPIPGKKKTRKVKCGVKTCRYAQKKDGGKNLIPRILMKLLKARKDTREEQKKFPKGSFQWKVKEGLQLAYKTIANSIYGQCGAKSSPIYMKDIAACTTATGRKLIYFTKDFFEKNYAGCVAIYGDTDSVFLKFDCKDANGKKLHGLDAVNKSIEWCIEGALAISSQLKAPHNLEFEKAILPFILIAKKRYHGHYFTEYGNPYFYSNSMGIVLKRRDNADIVKDIFTDVIDIIMKEHDIDKAMKRAQELARDVLDGKYPLDKFVITKSLKSYYKNPLQIAHNVLAQRIAKRDPGNKPRANDRLPYAYIKLPEDQLGDGVLQGDKIETPKYITDNNLKIDYKFYLTNQILKPIAQIFELVVDDVSKLFADAIRDYDYKHNGVRKITDWFTVKKVVKSAKDIAKEERIRALLAKGHDGIDNVDDEDEENLANDEDKNEDEDEIEDEEDDENGEGFGVFDMVEETFELK